MGPLGNLLEQCPMVCVGESPRLLSKGSKDSWVQARERLECQTRGSTRAGQPQQNWPCWLKGTGDSKPGSVVSPAQQSRLSLLPQGSAGA